MERIEWIARFMRRMEHLDANMRPGPMAELAGQRYEADPDAVPEAAAEEAGRDGVRRVD